ncbi:unnamed protein product [Didymodactylos carnosus]|uniref:Uncharacterized protein n=1 Tax=Didymodactylos carnosus TaxID=1234261 RepID=A0A8S2WSK8_9BILA|nr:unnamed protein product [Didymodactylos carnosus]
MPKPIFVLVASATKTTPYEVLFGQKPRSDVEFWRVVKEKNILDDDDLPGNVEEIDLGDELDTPIVNDTNETVPINVDTTASLAMFLTSSVTDLDDGTTVINLISFDSLKSPSRPSQDLSVVVDVAIPDTDIKTTQTYDLLNELIALSEGLKLGDCVGIKIHEVDRTNTDPKILPCLIVWKEKKK